MKEIIYIQAGPLANFTGQHFWNAQEAYFTYDNGDSDTKDEPFVDHDISFREGLSPSGVPTYCPRLLAFDWKGNYGTLRADLYEDPEEDDAVAALWNGDVVEFRQEQIPKSEYQKEIEHEFPDEQEPDDSGQNTAHKDSQHAVKSSDIRFWSDYSRVYYHPRSLHKIPDAPDWRDTRGDWNYGLELFQAYDQENAFMDDSLRHFMEECDALQAIQIMNDTSNFGAFIDSILTLIRDDYPKLTCLAFPFLSPVLSGGQSDDITMRVAINDALCLRNLKSLSTLSVPLQSPSTWALGSWTSDLTFDMQAPYHTSAVVSTHLESITLPLRMKGQDIDCRDYCNSVAYPVNVPFAHLSGILPIPTPLNELAFDERMYDFSKLPDIDASSTIYARRDTSRGFSRSDRNLYDAWQGKVGIPMTLYDVTHAPALPIPSSFPPILTSSQLIPSTPAPDNRRHTTYSARGLTSLYATSATSRLFAAHASFVDECIKRKKDFMSIMGMEGDDIRELSNELWVMHDAYHGDDEIQEEDLEAESDDVE